MAGLVPTSSPLPPPSNNGPPDSATGGPGNPAVGQGSSITSINSQPEGVPLPTPTSSLPNILPPASTGSFSSAVPTPSIVVYNNKANFGTNITGRVFPAQNQTKLFSWTLDSAAMPIDISWYGKVIDESPEAFNLSRATKIATARFSDNRASSEFLALHPSNTTLNLTASDIIPWYGQAMVIKINWETETDEEGFTQSSVFTVSDGTTDPKEFYKEVTGSQEDTQGVEVITKLGNPAPPSSGPSGGNGNGVGGSTSGDNHSGGGHSGLSTGAKVGIGVACGVVGLALIGVLLWFLLRRRRRRHFEGGYNAAGQTTNSFIAAKEVQASVAESPIVSPFTDEGDVRAIGPVIAMAPTHETAAAETTTTDPADRPDTAASGNRSRGIAHLVEEGMTEADILRLEEEERHLDAEIARAARRTSS